MTEKSPRRKTRVVIISPFFHPEPISTGRYNTYLAQSLVEQGAQVEVICSHPFYPRWAPTESHAQLPGMTIHRAGGVITYPRSVILRRLILEAWFAWHAWRTSTRAIKSADLVLAVLPPVSFLLLPRRARPSGAKCIAIVHDIIGVMATARANPLRRVVARVMSAVERIGLSRCDHVICLSESMREILLSRYAIAPESITVVYPFYTPLPESRPHPRVDDVLDKSFFNVVYSGALGEKQIPDQLLRTMRTIVATFPSARCHIFSAGPIFDRLKTESAAGCAGIHFHDLVPEEALARLYERSHVQIVPQAAGTDSGAFPSKLPNLIAARVPVLALCAEHTELGRLLRSTGTGIACDPEDEAKVLATIDGFMSMAGNPLNDPSGPHARVVAEHFSLPRLAQRILAFTAS